MSAKWVLLVGLLPAVVSAKEPFRFPEATHGTATLKIRDHLPILVVEGDPADMGAGVGALALKPGKRVLGYPRDLLAWRKLENLWPGLLVAGKGMYRGFPDEYRKELEAMVEAAGVERDPVVAGNTFFDLKKSLACSAILVEKEKSDTGGPILARNLDYPPLGYIQEYSLITVYRPKGRLAFASVGFPGLVGVVSGMNEAGVALGVLEVFDVKIGEPHFDAKGVPYQLCLRRVLEKAKSIDDAIKVLEGMKRTTTINVAIADRDGVAILEVTPKSVIRRPATRGVCVSTNHFCSAELKPEKPINLDQSFERFASLERVRGGKDKVSVADLGKHLHEVNLGQLTLQTMAFEPAALVLHLSIGEVPASRAAMKKVDLTPLLRPKVKKPDRR